METGYIMEPSNNIYTAIGKLFYAIAAVDKYIHPLELQTIKHLIGKEKGTNDHMKPNTYISRGSDEIVKSFYATLQDKTPSYDAFKEFVSYKQSHEQEFSPDINKWIWRMADKIAYSFANKNKSEVLILSKLKSVLHPGNQ